MELDLGQHQNVVRVHYLYVIMKVTNAKELKLFMGWKVGFRAERFGPNAGTIFDEKRK